MTSMQCAAQKFTHTHARKAAQVDSKKYEVRDNFFERVHKTQTEWNEKKRKETHSNVK